MDSSAACGTSCAMPTVAESSHSAAGALHPPAVLHSSYTLGLHCAVRFSSPKN